MKNGGKHKSVAFIIFFSIHTILVLEIKYKKKIPAS